LLLVLLVEAGPSMSNISNMAAAGANSDLFIMIGHFFSLSPQPQSGVPPGGIGVSWLSEQRVGSWFAGATARARSSSLGLAHHLYKTHRSNQTSFPEFRLDSGSARAEI